MWVLGIASAVLLFTTCSTEDARTKWSKPASAERRQGDWVPLTPPCLNCPLEQIHDGTALSSVLTPPQQSNAIPRGLLHQDTTHGLSYQSQNRPFQQQGAQPNEKFLPQLIQPQPFLQHPQLHAQSQFLSQPIPPQLINQQFLQQNEQFLSPNPLVDPNFLNQQNQFVQQGMHHLFHSQGPHMPFYSDINPNNANQPSENTVKNPTASAQNTPNRPESPRQTFNRSSSPKENEKEREEVQILYVPVETLKHRGRTSGRANHESQQTIKETRTQNPSKKFRHPIQPLKDLIPASQLKQYDSQPIVPPTQSYTISPEDDSKPLHSINNQDYITPSNVQDHSTLPPIQNNKQPLYREGYTHQSDQSLLNIPLQDNQEISHEVHSQSHGGRGNFRQPHRQRTLGQIPVTPSSNVGNPNYFEQQTTEVYEEQVQTTLPPPNQPPLSVYMETSRNSKVGDVLGLLKGSKTIPVLDTIGPDSPQVFVGPSNLNLPDGYIKFELPYLSSLDGNRIERRVEHLPFFVAPLNFDPPPGYAKIPFPAPHIGSVVVSNATVLQAVQSTPIEQKQQTVPEFPTVTFRDPYTIPVDISSISPQLPSLINSLQEDKYTLSPVVENIQTTTTTETSTTLQTRNYNSRRQHYRGSQRGYTTTSQAPATRKPSSRQRRPTSSRNYTQRKNIYSEPTTTTQNTTPSVKYVEDIETPSYVNEKELSITPGYNKENEQEFSQNQQISHFSNVNNLQSQYKTEQGRQNYQQETQSFNQNTQTEFVPHGQNKFINPLNQETGIPYRSISNLENSNVQTTTEINVRLKSPAIFDSSRDIIDDEQTPSPLVYREPGRQRYNDNHRQRGHIANLPEKSYEPPPTKVSSPVYLKHAYEPQPTHHTLQPEISSDRLPPVHFSTDQSDSSLETENKNTFDQGKPVYNEDGGHRTQFLNQQYFPQHNYDNSQTEAQLNHDLPEVVQRKYPQRGQYNQQQNPESQLSYNSQNDEDIQVTKYQQEKNRPQLDYDNSSPSAFGGITAPGQLRPSISTESYTQTSPKPSTSDEPEFNQRVTPRLTRFRTRGRNNAERKQSATYEHATPQYESQNVRGRINPERKQPPSSYEHVSVQFETENLRGRVNPERKQPSSYEHVTTQFETENPRGRVNQERKPPSPSYEHVTTQFETENPSTTASYSTTEAVTEKETPKPVLVRVRGRVRGRTRSQLKQTTTEAPNYPTAKGPSYRPNSDFLRNQEESRVQQTTTPSANEFENHGGSYLSESTRENTYSENEPTSTVASIAHDRFPSRKHNFRTHRRPSKPSTTTTTTSTTTSAPGTKYHIRTRKPINAQTRLQTGRGRIRRPTKPTTTTTSTTTTEKPNTGEQEWTGRNNYVQFIPSAPANDVPESLYKVSSPSDNVRYDTTETYELKGFRGGSQNVRLIPTQSSDILAPVLYQQDRVTNQNYEAPIRQVENPRAHEKNTHYRQGGSSRFVPHFDDYDSDEESVPPKPVKSQKVEANQGANQKEAEEFWNQAVTIQQSKSYVYMPETTVLTTQATPTVPQSTVSSAGKQQSFGDYDDYFNYQESSQYSTSDQSPFPSNEQRITYTGPKPALETGKSSQYSEKKLLDVPSEPEADSYEDKLKDLGENSKKNVKETFETKIPVEETYYTRTDGERKVEPPIKTDVDEEEKHYTRSSKPTDLASNSKEGRRRGAWVRVRVKKPKDVFVTAESQSFGSVSSNSLQPSDKKVFGDKPWSVPVNHKPEENKTKLSHETAENWGIHEVSELNKQNESIGLESSTPTTEIATEFSTETYETTVPNLTTENSVDLNTETTTLNTFVEDFQNFLTTTTEEIPVTTQAPEIVEPRVLGTSTTTEISLETEICYRGRCVKTKRIKGADSSDLMPIE